MAQEYMKRCLKLTPAILENADDDTYTEYLHRSIILLLQQLMALSKSQSQAPVASKKRAGHTGGVDFSEMIKVNKAVIKLQSMFRSKLALNKIEKDALMQKKRLEYAIKQQNTSNEQLALQEFKARLMKKHALTPEAFFRVCDPHYKKAVSCNQFKNQIANHNLQLSKG